MSVMLKQDSCTHRGGHYAPLTYWHQVNNRTALASEAGVDVTCDTSKQKFYALSHCLAISCFPSALSAYLIWKLLYQPGSQHEEEMGQIEK